LIIGSEPLHGDIAQMRRESTMAAFKKGQFRVLVATDVAARGLDIPDVELVIQDFFPREAETYVHRSGRTGRAGKTGTCIIVHRTEDRPYLRNLAKKISKSLLH
jgi:superfamily II DNA/RNA helicase